MFGLMQDRPLLISSLIDHAATFHPEAEIIGRTVEGPVHRTNYGEVQRQAKQVANALKVLGVAPGDRVGTLAWNTHRHFALYYGVSGSGAVLHTVNPRLFRSRSTTSSTTPKTRCCSSTPASRPWWRRWRRCSSR